MEEITQEILSVKVVNVKQPRKQKAIPVYKNNKTTKKPKPKGRSKCRGKRIRCVHTPDTAPSSVIITRYKSVTTVKTKCYARDGDEIWETPDELYQSTQWKKLRKLTMKKYGRTCMKCGKVAYALDDNGLAVTICVDHIKPVSKYPELVLDETNLQVLCSTCNKEKSYTDETDYRHKVL